MLKKLGSLLFVLAALVASCLLVDYGITTYYQTVYPNQYKEYVERYSQEFDLPPQLIFGVIYTESRFDPNAVSRVGARGLMQLMETTFEWARYRAGDPTDLDYSSMFDPETNIRYGSYTLSLLLEEFGSVETALCAYHAGWGNVKKWLANSKYSDDGSTLRNIPYSDTQYYVDKVTKTADIYNRLYYRSTGNNQSR